MVGKGGGGIYMEKDYLGAGAPEVLGTFLVLRWILWVHMFSFYCILNLYICFIYFIYSCIYIKVTYLKKKHIKKINCFLKREKPQQGLFQDKGAQINNL